MNGMYSVYLFFFFLSSFSHNGIVSIYLTNIVVLPLGTILEVARPLRRQL